MSFRGRSTYRPRGRRNDQPSSHLVMPVIVRPEPQPAIQELVEPKTGHERGDGPDVKGKQPLSPEHIKQLEAGFGSQTFVRSYVAGSKAMLKKGAILFSSGL
ncbi:P antigen family member 1 [Otolemur garnettii]|uniref:P antigen family member 1 n=1 Tax=Otolemur garnettii TaxID=30611 RepID=UPI000C7F2E71|nr:P antigen family member 1 [Otolemur garnettii]